MNTKYNIILSIIFLVLIIIIKAINIIKNKSINKDSIFYKKEKKLSIILTVIGIITFLITFVASKYTTTNNFFTSLLNTLPILILFLPISISNLYNTYINDEEEYIYIKTIITNKLIKKDLISKLNKAHINVVIISTKENKLKLNTIKKSETNIKIMRKNIIIKSNHIKEITEKYNSKMNFIYSTDPEETYNKIIKSREVCDNYVRTIKYNIITYASLILSILFINFIMAFPFDYNLSLTLLLKLITLVVSIFIYKKIPSDIDIPTRKQRDKNVFLYKQEILLLIFQIIPIMMVLSMPYMYFLASSTTQSFANTIFYLTFIFSNILLTLVNLRESLTIINLLQIIKNKYLFIYTILLTIISIALYYINIFNTERLELQNVIACIIVSLMGTVIYDLVKLARYTSVKGINKNDKNNKKHRRS